MQNYCSSEVSRETGIALRILQHAVAFRGAYSSAPVGQGLSWSHYGVLVRVASEKQRKFYAELARKEGWTSRELQKAIATDLSGRVAAILRGKYQRRTPVEA